jgi:SAM-dependent methyltransferase
MNEEVKLDLGVGFKKEKGWIGIDKFQQNGVVDVVMNLDASDLHMPYDNDSVDEIRAYHFLEHIHNLFPLMNECHRILKENGRMEIIVPSAESPMAFEDPSHLRFFTSGSFHYFTDSPPGDYINPDIKGKWKILLNDWTPIVLEDTEKLIYSKRREIHVILQPIKS